MSIRRFARVEARLEPHRWRWAQANAACIAEHWARRKAERPALFDGRILMVAGQAAEGDVLRARFFATDYRNLLAWIDGGFPDATVWNGFAMGALRGTDGGFLLGRMGAHTANAGMLYFPCGTPDMQDVTESGEVDLAASLVREIGEETGIRPDELAVEPGWSVVQDRGLLAFLRAVQLDTTAGVAAERVRRHIAGEERPELAGIEVVSGPADLARPGIPSVVRTYLEEALSGARAQEMYP